MMSSRTFEKWMILVPFVVWLAIYLVVGFELTVVSLLIILTFDEK